MKTLFILIDALKSEYLTQENMPFLYSMSKTGTYIKKIVPSPGFCERCEIFSGLDCYDTGNFTAIGYDPINSPYKNKKTILSIASSISKLNYKIGKYLLRKYRDVTKNPLKPYRIPFKSLANFTLTEDGDHRRIGYRTIFDVLDEMKLTYTLDGFTSLAEPSGKVKPKPVELFCDEKEKETYFIPIYIGDIDRCGHLYGSDIDKIRTHLQQIDSTLKELYEIADRSGYMFAVLGDHGMVPVKENVDITGILKHCDVKLHEDYEMFIDSTIVRFWFFNDKSKENISEIIQKELCNQGTIVDHNNYQKFRVPLDVLASNGKSLYGDLVWCANAGVLLVPDYFNSPNRPDKGMHGYLNIDVDNGRGLFICNGKQQVVEKSKLKDVCFEMCKLLEISLPNGIEWRREINGKV